METGKADSWAKKRDEFRETVHMGFAEMIFLKRGIII